MKNTELPRQGSKTMKKEARKRKISRYRNTNMFAEYYSPHLLLNLFSPISFYLKKNSLKREARVLISGPEVKFSAFSRDTNITYKLFFQDFILHFSCLSV